MLGEKIKELRQKKGLSQQKLSKLANVPQSTIWYIENGISSPTLKTLEKLARALKVPVHEFIDSQNK